MLSLRVAGGIEGCTRSLLAPGSVRIFAFYDRLHYGSHMRPKFSGRQLPFNVGKLPPEVGKLVREARKDKNLLVAHLAKRAKVSASTIYKLEAGYRLPHPDLLRDVCAALEVPLLDLAPDWYEDEQTRFRAARNGGDLGLGAGILRQLRRVSRAQVAAVIERHVSSVSRFERGFAAPRGVVVTRRSPETGEKERVFAHLGYARLLGFVDCEAFTREARRVLGEVDHRKTSFERANDAPLPSIRYLFRDLV